MSDDQDDHEEEEQGQGKPLTYATRVLSCTRCGFGIETKWMQLHVHEGFRAVYCIQCRKQERALFNKRQCGITWRQCSVHRYDPASHTTSRGSKKTSSVKETIQKRSSHRRAPITAPRRASKSVKPGRRSPKTRQSTSRARRVKFKLSRNPPNEQLRQRIREKEFEQSKARLKTALTLPPEDQPKKESGTFEDSCSSISAESFDDQCQRCASDIGDQAYLCARCLAIWCAKCTSYNACKECKQLFAGVAAMLTSPNALEPLKMRTSTSTKKAVESIPMGAGPVVKPTTTRRSTQRRSSKPARKLLPPATVTTTRSRRTVRSKRREPR